MNTFSFRQRLRSFAHALRGARTLIGTQHNTWIHVAATILVVGSGLTLEVSRHEWTSLIVAIVLVWLAEAFNTAVEFLADEVSLEQRARIGKAKDVAAFGVLLSTLAAIAIGLFVFLPHLGYFKSKISL